MRLYLSNGNHQNAYHKWIPGGKPYMSWKSNTNNMITAVSKNTKNNLPTNVKNCTNNCGFIANPIKHYRKQYINLNNSSSSYSNRSYVGSLDKPGGINITSIDLCNTESHNTPHNLQQNGYEYIIDFNSISCSKSCLTIKSANTIIDNDYCTSNKELLRKKCKTFNQNLPLTTSNTNLTSYPINDNGIIDCSIINNCTPIFAPSNTKYKVQGPITSSARIAAIRYCAQDVESRRCKLPTTDYNRFGTTAHNKSSSSDVFNNLTTMPGCNTHTCRTTRNGLKKYSNIKILK